jgi:hypothetical protein
MLSDGACRRYEQECPDSRTDPISNQNHPQSTLKNVAVEYIEVVVETEVEVEVEVDVVTEIEFEEASGREQQKSDRTRVWTDMKDLT